MFTHIGGLLAGIIGSLAGLGGGIVIVPLLLGLDSLLPISISQQVAVGTSMIAIVVISLSSSIAYWKHQLLQYSTRT
ncbi:sulfite exporter TauE/SafE family protein [Metabacillus sp. BG109]|uniref:Probable membrane transporter protein n=1 Tax=Metabacillus bambusae TaxID=2795218 RepID=A0ABS3MZW4_9BACI|nr:sulfite exporter TauE/SafE family protein [Metabacillus bambusae]